MRHRTCAGMPQQKGVAKRMCRMLCDKARSMISHSGLEHNFWAETVNMAFSWLIVLYPLLLDVKLLLRYGPVHLLITLS